MIDAADESRNACFAEHTGLVRMVVNRMNVPPDLFDDFVQVGMLELWKVCDRWDPSISKQYAVTAIRWAVIAEMRRIGRYCQPVPLWAEDRPIDVVHERPTPDQWVEDTEDIRCLREAIAELPEPSRNAVIDHFEGKTDPGVSREVARTRRRQGINKLRWTLKNRFVSSQDLNPYVSDTASRQQGLRQT